MSVVYSGQKDIDPTQARVVVFDDELMIGQLVARRLLRLGFKIVDSVVDKTAFVARLRTIKPNLVFLDLALGPTDAVEVFDLLRAHEFSGQIVLMSGGYAGSLDYVKRIGTEAGLTIGGILKKPFHGRDVELLLTRLGSETIKQALPMAIDMPPGVLQESIDKGWLTFWYQPKVELDKYAIVGAECLARVNHPDLGILYPDSFLKDADSSTLAELFMRSVDHAMLCRSELEYRGRPIPISVNVPACVMMQPHLLDKLLALPSMNKGRTKLVLELTETDLLDDRLAAQVFAVRAVLHGISIAIDDFGHGYATFERLRAVSFQELKLDKTMIDGCAHDASLTKICRAAVQLAHGFGAKAVAEGVERLEDLQIARALGFDLAQGHIFCRPVPIDEFKCLPGAYNPDTVWKPFMGWSAVG